MENKENSVKMSAEPKIESRFGFQKRRTMPSATVTKLCIVGAALSLTGILIFKSPNEPNIEDRQGLNPPESTDLSQPSTALDLEAYSAAKENERLKERTRISQRTIIQRLPGLQKIDRKRTMQIPPGQMLKAVLVTGASNGTVRAETKDSLVLQGETLIPEGSTLLGVGQSTEERLFIHFKKIVFKDGTFANIDAQAMDENDKTVGLSGASKFKRYAMKYGAAIGLNFVGGMAEGLQDRTVIGQQIVTKPDAKNALLNGASRATYEMANETITDLRNQPPAINIPAGREILIVFDSGE